MCPPGGHYGEAIALETQDIHLGVRMYILAVAMSATPRPMTTTCQRASQACALACEESVRCSWGRYTVPGISLARVAASSR